MPHDDLPRLVSILTLRDVAPVVAQREFAVINPAGTVARVGSPLLS